MNLKTVKMRSYFLFLFVFHFVNCTDESKFVRLYVDENDKAQEAFKRIFNEPYAETLSRGHGWTEGPVIVPIITKDRFSEILYFSDTIQDKIWRYEESEFEPHHQFTVAVQESGSCESARTDCETVAEPGSNGLAFDKLNNNLLICQHGARSIIKIPLDPSDGMPLPEFDVSDYENQCNRKTKDK